ncbi:MAG TPA: ABC transporter permease [Candidatus Saccharimonadales bacterium]|nr:ABC transporter permease [Candidatus Saccharimonadales bacterium]
MDKSKLLSAVQPERRSYLYWLLSDSWVMTKRSVTHIVRSLDQVMSLILFPVMFMLLNRYVLGGAIDTGNVSYVNYLFAGILVQTLAFGANYTTINLAVDMKEGIVDRFKSLPMASSALMLGHITADLFRNIISGVIIVLIGFLVGFRPNATPTEWLLVFGLAMLFTLAISWLSAILGLIVKSLEAAQWVGFVIIFPLTFISSAFVPLHTLPPALRVFAENQPLTHVIDTMRSWLVGTPLDNSGWLAVVWCVGIIVVSMPIAAYLFRRHTTR